MTHKEFFAWLEGYLYDKLEKKHIDISPIVEKMSHVKEDSNFFPHPRTIVSPLPIEIPRPKNPFEIQMEKYNVENNNKYDNEN